MKFLTKVGLGITMIAGIIWENLSTNWDVIIVFLLLITGIMMVLVVRNMKKEENDRRGVW